MTKLYRNQNSIPYATPYRDDNGAFPIFGTRYYEDASINGDLPATKVAQYVTITNAATVVVGPLLEGQLYDFIFVDATTPQSAVPQAVYFRSSVLSTTVIDTTKDAIWPCHMAGNQRLLNSTIRIRDNEPFYLFRGLGTDVKLIVCRRL